MYTHMKVFEDAVSFAKAMIHLDIPVSCEEAYMYLGLWHAWRFVMFFDKNIYSVASKLTL